jgi:hypothetical protein
MLSTKFILSSIVILLGIAFISFQMGCLHPMSESEIDKSKGLNGSFESFKNGLPINWLVYTSQSTSTGQFKIEADTMNKKEGHHSLYFQVEKCSNRGGHYSPGIAQEIEVKAGVTYHIQCWVKQFHSNCRLTLSSVDVKHASSIQTIECTNQNNDWNLIEFDYQIPQNMNRLRFEFNVLSPGECWIDDVQVIPHLS